MACAPPTLVRIWSTAISSTLWRFGATHGYKVFRIQGSGSDIWKTEFIAHIIDLSIACVCTTRPTERYFILCDWQADFNP